MSDEIKELVGRLRASAHYGYEGIMIEAAFAIERLVKERDEARSGIERIARDREIWRDSHQQAKRDVALLTARWEQAEAHAAKLREALEPFAYYYRLNDCHERRPDDAIEVPIADLLRAKRTLRDHQR